MRARILNAKGDIEDVALLSDDLESALAEVNEGLLKEGEECLMIYSE